MERVQRWAMIIAVCFVMAVLLGPVIHQQIFVASSGAPMRACPNCGASAFTGNGDGNIYCTGCDRLLYQHKPSLGASGR